MLLQRLSVAAVGLPLLAVLLWAPERIFAALVTVVIAAGTVEFILATPERPTLTTAIAGGALAALFAASLRTVIYIPHWSPLALVGVTAFALAILLWWGEDAAGAIWWLGGVLYTGVLGAHWLLLRVQPDGVRWLIVMLAMTFATDTAAYATGRLIGRHILWPAVSPSKTWEGFAGGMVVGALAAALLPGALGIAPRWPWLLVFAVLLPFMAIAGDFLESALKRRMGVKDMSGVLPGHGGLLDRLDSLLLVGPSLYWVLQWAIPR